MRKTIILDFDNLKEQYYKLKTIDNVANYFSGSGSTIKKNFKKYGISFQNTNKIKVNDMFFNEGTANSFFIAGVFAADGCVGRDLSIRLSTRDKLHLEKIKTVLGSERL